MQNQPYSIGQINFGSRDSFITLGVLIDEISAQEELVEDLCLYLGELITENLWLQENRPTDTYAL